MTLSLNILSKKDHKKSTLILKLFKINMESVLTIQITSWKILFRGIEEQRNNRKWNFRNHPFEWIHNLENTFCGYTFQWRRAETNWEITLSTTQSLDWWTHEYHFPNLLWYSISQHEHQWLDECTNRTWFPCSQTWHEISHAPTTWTHHVLLKEHLQN